MFSNLVNFSLAKKQTGYNLVKLTGTLVKKVLFPVY
ncbi:hypothetical protein JOC77_004152 [Peribacillus deserti]|uniref:Uncharacterized protein n=1 Tax=Peribacillus deserti TaxID=673318 RepID=A0ABS2QP14_9BACI|nr:hypothetical protein [Peribacillus deserti]